MCDEVLGGTEGYKSVQLFYLDLDKLYIDMGPVFDTKPFPNLHMSRIHEAVQTIIEKHPCNEDKPFDDNPVIRANGTDIGFVFNFSPCIIVDEEDEEIINRMDNFYGLPRYMDIPRLRTELSKLWNMEKELESEHLHALKKLVKEIFGVETEFCCVTPDKQNRPYVFSYCFIIPSKNITGAMLYRFASAVGISVSDLEIGNETNRFVFRWLADIE